MKKINGTTQVGIWIDTKQAKIVKINSNGETLKTILSDIETRTRVDGEKGNQGRIGDQYIDLDKKHEAKIDKQKKDFSKRIIEEIKKASSLVIFGPADMKFSLAKELQKQPGISLDISGIESADSMTDNQIIAWVKDFYSK